MSGNSNVEAKPASKSRGKRLLQNLLLACVVFFLCLVIAEVALRFAGYGNLEIYQPDEKLFWRLKPNQDCYTKVDHKPVHINAEGTRGPEFEIEKPLGTFRILSLGDSRTFGWGLADEETYSQRLGKLVEDVLKIKRPTRVEVINAGVNAWSYSQMAIYFRERGIKYHPDLVLLGEANLWTQFSEKSDPEFVRKFMSRVRLKNFLRRFALYHFVVEVQLQEFYQRNRTKFIPVDPKRDALFKEQQQADPDAVFRSAIEDVCRTAESNHIQPVLLFLPTLDDLQTTNQSHVLRAKQTASRSTGVPLVDLTLALAPEGKALYLESDPVHFNVRGNEIVAENIFVTVTNLIAP
jgi:lysophospholipase L1-like esterase